MIPEAWSVPTLKVNRQRVSRKQREKMKHLRDLDIPDSYEGDVELLLGANVIEAVIQKEVRFGSPGQPVAVRTAFGWALTGLVPEAAPEASRQVMYIGKDSISPDAATELNKATKNKRKKTSGMLKRNWYQKIMFLLILMMTILVCGRATSSTGIISPADDCTGGVTASHLCKDRTWLTGQTFLEADEVLSSVPCEVENMIDNRSIADVTDEYDGRYLTTRTPNHFLLGRNNAALAPGNFNDDMNSRKWWRRGQALADHLWNRWRKECLETPIHRRKRQTEGNLQADDVVLIVESDTPRGLWPPARVTEVLPGPDGRVRTVRLITTTGATFTRPATKVALLEDAADTVDAAAAQ